MGQALHLMLRAAFLAAALACAPAGAAYAQQPIIDARVVLAPPPIDASAGAAADRLALRPQASADRLARANADKEFSPWAALSPVLGQGFAEANLPRTARVFATLLAGLSPPIGASKDHFRRERPYSSDPGVLRCGPADGSPRANYSYPSGHAAAGWAWALVMAELLPDRAGAILARGREYGESRVICGLHYPSDIEAGRILAAAVVARLHADASFRRQLGAARREIERVYPPVQH